MLRETERLAASRFGIDSAEFDRRLALARQERAEAVAQMGRAVSGWVKGLFSGLAEAHRRRAAYAELNGLDDRMLRDLGLSRGELWAAVDGMVDRAAPSNDNQVAATAAVAANENSPKHRAA